MDSNEQGGGLGAALLKDALLRPIQAAEIAGLRAMLVHAKDDSAKRFRFYEKFGFEPSSGYC
jgi:GNAT superfamily N-acetyltransferase